MPVNLFKVSKYFLFISVLSIAIVIPSSLFPFIVGKYIWFRVSVDSALVFFLLGLLFQSNAEQRGEDRKFGTTRNFLRESVLDLRKSALVWLVSLFVLIFLLAGFFGVDPIRSFWSNFERGEGGLQLLHLWVFFMLLIILLKDKKDWQVMFWFAVIAGILVLFYGIGAGLKYADVEMVVRRVTDIGGTREFIEPSGNGGLLYQTFRNFVGPSFSDPNYRFQGSIGNPAYMAAYAIFMLFYVSYLLASKYKNRLKSVGAIILWFLFALFLATFFGAATRGAFLGFIAALIVFLGYLGFSSSRFRKWFVGLGVIIFILVIALIQFKNTAFIKSLPVSRIFDISFSARSFEDRAIMWKTAIDGSKERPILGWGPENFLQVFDKHFNIKYFKPPEAFGAWFDRAHSVYFDYLVETGILGLLSFLGIWVVFYWHFFRGSRKNAEANSVAEQARYVAGAEKRGNNQNSTIQKALIFSLPVAYLVQGIVLFDVLPIYINIFLFLAFAVYKFNNRQATE